MWNDSVVSSAKEKLYSLIAPSCTLCAVIFLTGCSEPEAQPKVPSTVDAIAEVQSSSPTTIEPVPKVIIQDEADSPVPPEDKPATADVTPAAQPFEQYAGQSELLVAPAISIKDKDAKWSWPLFRGTELATGVSGSPLPPDDELQVLWQHKIKKGEIQATACLALLNGTPAAIVGDMDGLILALDLETAEVIWTYKIKFGYVCSPAFYNNRIYIGNIDGIFLCLDANGKLVWEYQAEMEIDGSPTFYEDLVLFTSQDSYLYALKAETGAFVWKVAAGDQLRCAPIVIEGLAFLAGCDATLHSIVLKDQTSGEGVNIESPTGCTPAVMGDLIFFGSEQAGFMAVDWKTQTRVWSYSDDNTVLSVHGNAAVTAGRVIFGDTTRRVHALDPQTGKKIWEAGLRSGVDGSPVIVGDRVFVGGLDGRLYSLSLSDGTIRWQKEFGGQFRASPAVGFSRLVIASDDGVIYCLGSTKR